MARQPVALVLGGAATLWEDVRKTHRIVDPAKCIIVACNDAGFLWPGRLDHWVTLHAQEMWARENRRRRLGYLAGYETWTRPFPAGTDVADGFDHILEGWEEGSSGLFATGVALEVADKAILCGVPMTATGHVNRDEGPWEAATGYREAWWWKMPELWPRVRSWSGWTREWLGEPTRGWVGSVPAKAVDSLGHTIPQESKS